MTKEEIEADLTARILKGGEVQPQLTLHYEKPPHNPFFGMVYFLGNDIVAFCVSQLPAFKLGYDVYVLEI